MKESEFNTLDSTRRVAGSEALHFVRDPLYLPGEDAASVIAPEEHEQALFDAGIFFHHFRLIPQLNAENKSEVLRWYLSLFHPFPSQKSLWVLSPPGAG